MNKQIKIKSYTEINIYFLQPCHVMKRYLKQTKSVSNQIYLYSILKEKKTTKNDPLV